MRIQRLTVSLLSLVGMFAVTTVSAHIKNEASQFPDIEFSDARFDIVMLVGAGIVPQTPVFEPDKPLSMMELATWTALARGMGPGGETPDTKRLAEAVIDAGLATSLEGNATYANINTSLFDDRLVVVAPDTVPTKAEAASFIAGFIGTPEGEALLAPRGLSMGQVGEVVSVDTLEGRRGYVVAIGAVKMPMDGHGRVANGPTDLFQWEGLYVVRSFVKGSGENAAWTYIEAGAAPATEPPAAKSDSADVDDAPLPSMSDLPKAVIDDGKKPGNNLLTYLVIAVGLLGALLFFQGRRKG